MNEFEKYFEMSEQTGWRTTDLNWNNIDYQNISEFDKQLILAVSIIEHGVPYYTETWSRVAGIDQEWELWQFVTLWAGEEHRHSYSLKKLSDLLNVTGDSRHYDKVAKGEFYYNQVAESNFAKLHKEHCPTDCYSTIGGMVTYAAIQELATAKFYQTAVKKTNSKFIKELLTLIAKDELKHYSYYSQAVKRYYEKGLNKEQYLEEVYHAVINFSMPHLIYPVKFDFFENEKVLSSFDFLEIKLKVAKFLSFNKALVKRLVLSNEYKDVPIEKNDLVHSA